MILTQSYTVFLAHLVQKLLGNIDLKARTSIALNMNNLIQVERGCMICSIRAVAVHFSTHLRLYQPYACATDTDGEGQKNGQKLTHQSGEEP